MPIVTDIQEGSHCESLDTTMEEVDAVWVEDDEETNLEHNVSISSNK